MILSLIKLPSGNFSSKVVCLGKELEWKEVSLDKLIEKIIFSNPFTDKAEIMEIIGLNWPEYIN